MDGGDFFDAINRSYFNWRMDTLSNKRLDHVGSSIVGEED